VSWNSLPRNSAFVTRVTDEFRFCCLATGPTNCFPRPDEFSTCEDLMSNFVLRTCIWVLGLVSLAGNSVVIIWRLKDSRDSRVCLTRCLTGCLANYLTGCVAGCFGWLLDWVFGWLFDWLFDWLCDWLFWLAVLFGSNLINNYFHQSNFYLRKELA